MLQIYPNEALPEHLKRITQFTTLRYRLFVNNVTPTFATVLADLTEETTGSYAPVDVIPGDWVSYTVTGNIGTALAPPISFTPSGVTWTTYGYYVTEVGGTKILYIARFDSAPVTTLTGVPLLLTPKISDFSKFI